MWPPGWIGPSPGSACQAAARSGQERRSGAWGDSFRAASGAEHHASASTRGTSRRPDRTHCTWPSGSRTNGNRTPLTTAISSARKATGTGGAVGGGSPAATTQAGRSARPWLEALALHREGQDLSGIGVAAGISGHLVRRQGHRRRIGWCDQRRSETNLPRQRRQRGDLGQGGIQRRHRRGAPPP